MAAAGVLVDVQVQEKGQGGSWTVHSTLGVGLFVLYTRPRVI